MTARRGGRLTEADRTAWAGFTRHMKPLPGRTAVAQPAAVAPPVQPPVRRHVEVVARPGVPAAPLAIGASPAGVDRATWQRFRTGKLAAERKLDLHGMTAAQRAFNALTGFLRAAHAERVRCVEIVTGRGSTGESRAGGGAGVIRRELPLWLNGGDLRPLVLGAAYPHGANPGAVRLLLRRVR